MTKTTLKRQLDLLIGGVLRAHQIDNLQLEVDLSSSVYRMVSEGERDPAKWVSVREDILSSILAGARDENEIVEMEGRVKGALGITINGSHRFEDMLKFLVRKDKEGQPIEKYGRWCRENPYEAPKAFQIAKNPDLLKLTWEMAFAPIQDRHVIERPEHVRFTESEDVPNTVPNPYKKPAILRRQASPNSD